MSYRYPSLVDKPRWRGCLAGVPKITFSRGGKIEYFYACPPFFWRDASGIKLKKKVTDGSTITTTEYMQGFQYTNNVLDFFPHAEGYAKALPASLGGGSSYQFKYVFTYTDHLGNIRLKYAQDPSNNNRISILEEDHYYPYGLKHTGYNSFHQIFATEDGDGTGTGIVLTPVNPFLGDSHKYKFGGKEYQDEFDVNTYDFGARNYDPALARWMNLDPLAEMMRRNSPYNYAFNNPIYFIDPDGMIPIAVTSLGMGIDGVKDIVGDSGGNSKGIGSMGSKGGSDESQTIKGLSLPVENSNDKGVENDIPMDSDSRIIATKYIDERGNVLLNTEDGSDDIITIPNIRLAEFLKNIYWTPENMLNSQGWNDYWKTEILGFDNSESMENLLSSTASQASRQRMINSLQSGTISNQLRFVITEVLYQNLNPLNHLPTPISARPVNPWLKFNRQMGAGKFTKQTYGSSKAAKEARKGAYSNWKRENRGYY